MPYKDSLIREEQHRYGVVDPRKAVKYNRNRGLRPQILGRRPKKSCKIHGSHRRKVHVYKGCFKKELFHEDSLPPLPPYLQLSPSAFSCLLLPPPASLFSANWSRTGTETVKTGTGNKPEPVRKQLLTIRLETNRTASFLRWPLKAHKRPAFLLTAGPFTSNSRPLTAL